MNQSTWEHKVSDPVLFLDIISRAPINAAEKLLSERMEEMNDKNQIEMLYGATAKNAAADMLFLEFVEDGLTKQELQTNIDRRPSLWGRYANWLEKLPSEPLVGDDVTIIKNDDGLELSQAVNVIDKIKGLFIVEDNDGDVFEVSIDQIQQ